MPYSSPDFRIHHPLCSNKSALSRAPMMFYAAPMRTPPDPPTDPSSIPPHDPPPTDRLLTVKDAATILDISPEAVRARLKRGTLQRETGEDGTVYVRLNADLPGEGADGSNGWTDGRIHGTNGWTGDGTATDSDMIEVLSDQVIYLREQLDKEREANRENRRLLAAALEHMRALEPSRDNSQEARESPETASEKQGDGGASRPTGVLTAPLVAV
jgi:hypothetical protein